MELCKNIKAERELRTLIEEGLDSGVSDCTVADIVKRVEEKMRSK